MAVIGVMSAGTLAMGAEPGGQPKMKHQVIAQVFDCMSKRMSASQGSSFNEARKACRNQLIRESDNAPTDGLSAAAVPAKP